MFWLISGIPGPIITRLSLTDSRPWGSASTILSSLHNLTKCTKPKQLIILFSELMFLETSAKTGENVEEAFLKCSKTILAKIENGELDPERIGSGIQYGTGTSKRLNAPKKPARTPSDCACLM